MRDVDEAITSITTARDEEAAKAIAHELPHRVLFAVADQLYINVEGHGTQWVRNAIVKEART